METGNQVPKGLRINPTKQVLIIYNTWQSSLMLDGLSRALTGPYSLQGLYLRPGTPATKA